MCVRVGMCARTRIFCATPVPPVHSEGRGIEGKKNPATTTSFFSIQDLYVK